jgi:hypothetical protein
MQIVYRARGIEDARTACSLLASVGIDAHIADQGLWEVAGHRPEADVIRVLVDNPSWTKHAERCGIGLRVARSLTRANGASHDQPARWYIRDARQIA